MTSRSVNRAFPTLNPRTCRLYNYLTLQRWSFHTRTADCASSAGATTSLGRRNREFATLSKTEPAEEAVKWHGATVIVRKPEETTTDEILNAIKPLRRKFTSKAAKSNACDLILLLSRTYASTLRRDDVFLQKFVERLWPGGPSTQDDQSTSLETSAHQVRLLVAVVDRIPTPSLSWVPKEYAHDENTWRTAILRTQRTPCVEDYGYEGLAYMACSKGNTILRNAIVEAARQATHNDPVMPLKRLQQSTNVPSLSIILEVNQQKLEQHYHTPFIITLPLAQTVFEAGLPHLLQMSEWRISARGAELTWKSDSTLPHCEIHIGHAGVDFPNLGDAAGLANYVNAISQLTAPLVQLTNFKTIHDSMGNVLRTLGPLSDDQFDGSEAPAQGIFPASQELEEVVPAFVEQLKPFRPDETDMIAHVWALIIPKAILKQRNIQGRVAKILKKMERQHPALQKQNFRNHMLLLKLGARLHRVMSGGGGWALKSGLISLDPESSYMQKASDLPPEEDMDMEALFKSAVGSIAEKGDLVLFLGGAPYPGIFQEPDAPVHDLSLSRYRKRSYDFGMLPGPPDTIDELTVQMPSSRHPCQGSKIESFSKHFGALSLGGLAVEVPKSNGRVLRSKLDVPSARFTYQQYPSPLSMKEESTSTTMARQLLEQNARKDGKASLFRKVRSVFHPAS